MRICVILEGCYPYVTGGVSTWMHQYIKAMPEHEFVLLTIGASSEDRGKFKYELPQNVVEVREIFLQDALKLPSGGRKYRFSGEELQALTDFVHCENPDWEVLFGMYNDRKMSPMSFLTSPEFLHILTRICDKDFPYTAFSDSSTPCAPCSFQSCTSSARTCRRPISITPSPQATAGFWQGWEAIATTCPSC